MATEVSPEDEKFLDSLGSLLKVSQEHEKLKNDVKPSTFDGVQTDESENQVEIPSEQQIDPAIRVEPLKSMVEPDYVRKVIRQMDTMSTEQLKEALLRLKVSTGGNKKTLRKRVAQYYRKENSLLNRKIEPNSEKTLRYFDYLIATDFECTCVEIIYDYPHEIIELPAVLIDVRDMRIISEFRTYVRPVRNPVLSDFCVQFTKIAQETVDEAPYFREGLEKLYQWMRKFGLGEKNARFAFVTDGPHDMWKFMQFQCLLSNIRMPHMFRNFINIKKTFKEKFNGLVKGNGKSGIENMLDRLDLAFIGNKHSGLDDARNIAQIALQMMKLKIELRINQKCSWIEPATQTLKDHEEEIGDNVDLQTIDVSRRDFQLWLRRLPLKLSSVTRREFLTEEYLDCESCDELTDEKIDRQTIEIKMSLRAMIKQEHDNEFDKIDEMRGKPDSGKVKPPPPPQPPTEVEGVESDDESESYIEDYQRQFEMLDLIGSSSSYSQTDGVELNSVWRESINSSENEYVVTRATSSSISTLPTSSVVDALMDSDSGDNMSLMAPPPKNSLASSNRHNRKY